MSNPLDGRIRALAREEAAQAIRSAGAVETTALDVDSVQQKITDLHEDVHHVATTVSRLEARLAVLEKVAGLTDQEQAAPTSAARRGRRKTATDDSEA